MLAQLALDALHMAAYAARWRMAAGGASVKKRNAVLCVVACALAGLAAVCWFAPTSGINAGFYGQIQNGMTQQQVEEILGAPADYEEFNCSVDAKGNALGSGPEPHNGYWLGHNVTICVRFDDDEKVCGKALGPNKTKAPSLWNHVLAWFP